MTSPVLSAGRKLVEGFSIVRATILDGTVAAEETPIYGVRNASLTPDTGTSDNVGDDKVLSTWNWLNFATLNVQSGFVSYDLAAKLSGTEPTVSLDGSTISIPWWQEDAGNQPPYPVLVRMASKDRARNVLYLDLLLYAVQFGPMTVEGPAYKQGLTVSYPGKALVSDIDELGDPIVGKARVGRLISTIAA